MAGEDVMALVLEIMDRPWSWGESDCCAAACDVFAALHGIDPMASLRGTYASRAEAEAMIAREGGLDALAARLAAISGLRLSEGSTGDIGVSEDGRASGGRALLICVGRCWAGKSPRGVSFLPRAEVAWGV